MSRRLLVVPLLITGYPVAAFLALRSEQIPMLWLAAPDAVMTVGLLTGLMATGSTSLRLTLGLLAAGVCLLALNLWPAISLSALPVIMNLGLAQIFAGSLASGRTALITRIARLERRGPLPPELEAYTRHLTQAWAWLLRGLALNGFWLGLTASTATVLLFANTLNLVVIGVFFVAEYGYRRWRFRHHDHPPLLHLIRTLTEQGWIDADAATRQPRAGDPSSP
ncbi:MAG: hypothetical protein ACK443_05600 [Methylococcaceae bacterium]|jgi:uncharacterized membrane protein